MRAVAPVLAAVALVACDAAAPPCSIPRTRLPAYVHVTNVDDVDLLFMIDNSNSMAEEQVALIAQLPRLVAVLASGDRDADGARDFNPVRSLHVGIITSDLGAGPNTGVPTCARGLGEDGILRSRSRLTTAPCRATYPSGVFEFDRDTDDAAAFAAEVGCVANLSTGGCGFEQQLESALKAVTPIAQRPWTRSGYVPPLFVSADGVADSVAGNADGPNLGFLRANSLLAIVMVTDEEDCSVRDYGLFDADDLRFASVPLNERCHAFRDPSMGILQPVERYVDGFLGLRRDPALLVFSAIVGIPPDAEPPVGSTPDYRLLLAHLGTRLEPTCSTINGVAYPPFRIVEAAAGLSEAGVAVSLSSICSTDFGPAIDAVIARIAEAVTPAPPCLPRALPVDSDGRVDCELLELLPPTGDGGSVSDCASLPGRELVELVEDAGVIRQRCRLAQLSRLDLTGGIGWYYDDAVLTPDIGEACSSTPQRIAFRGIDGLAHEAEPSFECAGIASGGGDSDIECDGDEGEAGCRLGQFCDLARPRDLCASGRSPRGEDGAALVCDAVEHACRVPCARDEDCRDAGLLGHACDTRTNAEAAGASVEDVPEALRDDVRGTCGSPRCR